MVQILKMVRILKNGAPGVLAGLPRRRRTGEGRRSLQQAEIFIAEGRRLLRVVSSNDRSPTRLGKNLAGQVRCR